MLTIPTYDELFDLIDEKKAEIIDTAYEGTCLLIKEFEYNKEYVILPDNTVITRYEDSLIDPIFPKEVSNVV